MSIPAPEKIPSDEYLAACIQRDIIPPPYRPPPVKDGEPEPLPTSNRQQYNPMTKGVFGLSKLYCTHWMRTGNCDFTQQGCKYQHMFPAPCLMAELGYDNYPGWFRLRLEEFPAWQKRAKDFDPTYLDRPEHRAKLRKAEAEAKRRAGEQEDRVRRERERAAFQQQEVDAGRAFFDQIGRFVPQQPPRGGRKQPEPLL